MQPIIFDSAAQLAIQRGVNQIVDAIRPTLGPCPRFVAVSSSLPGRMPELLDNGGVIARRIIELPDPDENMGAMLIRSFLWRLYATSGDGTTTAAVIFQTVLNEGLRHLASGGDPMRLRGYLDEGAQLILNELTRRTVPAQGRLLLAQIAESICYDPPLATLLGEIFDVIGEFGRLEIRSGSGRDLEREYVEGMYWSGGVLSRHFLTDQSDQERSLARLEDAAVLISDLTIDDPAQLIPVLQTAFQAGVRSLVIVARSLSDRALSLLLANYKPGVFRAIAVQTPGENSIDQAEAMEDLAMLTGGQPFFSAAGMMLNSVQPVHLGFMRQVWADRSFFGLKAGKGNPRELRTHIGGLRTRARNATAQEERRRLQIRIGKLLGGSATLWIGGANQNEITARKTVAERSAESLRGALMEGLLPGSGAALFSLKSVLDAKLAQSADLDERAAYRILMRAVEAPMRTIIVNAGYEAAPIMAEIERIGQCAGFDARIGQTVDVGQAGIWDVAAVQKSAVQGAITQAALALTINALVHTRHPVQALMNP